MKALCDRELFLEAYKLAGSVRSAKTTSPISSSLLMTCGVDHAEIVATNYDIYVRVNVLGVNVSEPGLAVLDGDRIGSAVEHFSGELFDISTKGAIVKAWSEKSKVALNSENPNLFPKMPEWPGGQTWQIKGSDLAILTDRTSFATDPKGSKYALGGCLLEFGDDKLGMIGTDGRRVSFMERPYSGPASQVKASVPPAVLRMARRFCRDESTVEIGFSGGNPEEPNQIHIKSDMGEICGRLVVGRFPVWRNYIPTKFTTVAKAEAAKILSAVEVARVVSSEESRGIIVEITGGVMRLSASVADRGFSDDSVDVEQSGPDVQFILDGRYFPEALTKVPADAIVSVNVISEDNPIVLTVEDGWLHSLFPISPPTK